MPGLRRGRRGPGCKAKLSSGTNTRVFGQVEKPLRRVLAPVGTNAAIALIDRLSKPGLESCSQVLVVGCLD